MQDFSIVNMLNSKTKLSKKIKYSLLRYEFWCPLDIAFFHLALYQVTEITIVRVVHNDAKLFAFGFVDLSKGDDVWVLQYLQNFGFLHGLSPLNISFIGDIDLLDDSVRLIRHAFDQGGRARLTRAQGF